MEFNETNWKECLEALNFTEDKNESFGGMVVYKENRNDFNTLCGYYIKWK